MQSLVKLILSASSSCFAMLLLGTALSSNLLAETELTPETANCINCCGCNQDKITCRNTSSGTGCNMFDCNDKCQCYRKEGTQIWLCSFKV